MDLGCSLQMNLCSICRMRFSLVVFIYYSCTISHKEAALPCCDEMDPVAKFDCSSGVSQMEEQFYIMKPTEVVTRSFKLYPTTDQAARYACSAILRDSDFSEVDRAECQFTTTTTVLENEYSSRKRAKKGNSMKNCFNTF
ncbi:hypothetical protein ACS0TY_022152 [Phlomoides rotata]